MLLAVGTSNPVKVQAVEAAFSKFFVISVVMKEVPSGVAPQPVGAAATIAGATNRARAALASEPRAAFGIGIEAGLLEVPYTISGFMDQQFAAIIDRDGFMTLGGGPAFEYPKCIVDRVFTEKIEVGEAMERLTGIHSLGKKQGAIGFFSKGALDRARLTEQAVLMALIPRLNRGLYLAERASAGQDEL